MQNPVSKGSSAVLVGVGAAIAIIVLLVLQSAASVPFSLRTETATSTTDLTTTVTATPSTTTSIETTTSAETVTSTNVTTDYIPVNDSGDSALLADCQYPRNYAYSFGRVAAGTSSPAVLCIQVYEFNTSPVVLNTTSLLEITGVSPANGYGGRTFDGGANFTVTASVNQLLLGGPADANEGTIVALGITAMPGASGTYWLSLRGYQLGDEPLECGPNGDLVAGTGQPDYAPPGTEVCTTIIGGTPQFPVPGMGYTVPGGVILYRVIIDLLASTQ
jgi:hypothetical protein